MQNNYCRAPGLSAYPPSATYSATYSVPGSGESLTASNSHLVIWPERSEWECELFGAGRSIVLNPKKGEVPNWFWRQMQYLCFGNKWKKIKN
jgi:hypothetical protein